MTPPVLGGARARRRAAYRAGHVAEGWAAVALMLKGYRILARRYTVRGGEIDIVAKRGDVIAFVEVKARSSLADALAAVTAQKQIRIERAAAAWLARNRWAQGQVFRADAMLVTMRRWPTHIPDAFPLRIG